MFEEVLKLFHGGAALKTYELLRHYGLFEYLFPLTEEALTHEDGGFPITLVPRALENTDVRVNADRPVTPAFLFAALLWEPMRLRLPHYHLQGKSAYDAQMFAADDIIRDQLKRVSIPRRFSVPMREIWFMQDTLTRRNGRQVLRLIEHPRFRAAYDFLLLRAETGESTHELADWWTRFQAVSADERRGMIAALGPGEGGGGGAERPGGGKRRRRRRRRKSGQQAPAGQG